MKVNDSGKATVALDVQGIMKILPHRYPLLMVDRVTQIIPGESIIALKNVTVNEPFFAGHLPGNPIMPGVMQQEGLAQAAGLLLALERRASSANGYLAGFEGRVRFKKVVRPGDQLTYKVRFESDPEGRLVKFRAQAFVEDERTTSEFTIVLAPSQDS